MENENKTLRKLLVRFLKGETHMRFDEAVADFPPDKFNERPPHVPYTPWHLLEHIRRTQRDILDFMTDPAYREPEWPKDYWPEQSAKADGDQWRETVAGYHRDLDRLATMAEDPKTNLDEVIGWGSGQSVLEEIMKVADHTSYHLGEFAILRQVMETWPKGRN